jgi:hypothetical protein
MHVEKQGRTNAQRHGLANIPAHKLQMQHPLRPCALIAAAARASLQQLSAKLRILRTQAAIVL